MSAAKCTHPKCNREGVGTFRFAPGLDGSWLCQECLTWAGNVRPGSAACDVCGEDPPGRKDDTDKPRWDLLPWRAAEAVVSVLTYGAKKYAPENWRKVEEPRRRYFAAAMRHLYSWYLGERLDPESGKPHLAHAICCLMFLLEPEQESR